MYIDSKKRGKLGTKEMCTYKETKDLHNKQIKYTVICLEFCVGVDRVAVFEYM